MSINDAQPGRPPHILHGNGDPQGPLRAGPWGARERWDHEQQRWVLERPGRPPAPRPPSPDAAHQADHGHAPEWGKNCKGHRICRACRRESVARYRARKAA